MTKKNEVAMPKQDIYASVYDIFELIAFCAAAVIIVYTFFIRMTIVNQHSMDQTLAEGDYALVSDFLYTPQTGDIVVVQNISLPEHSEPLIKRVIAVGGDTLNINYTTWTVTLTHNGSSRVLDEMDYLYLAPNRSLTSDWCDVRESDGSYTYQVPEGFIFVMGDNRNVSADSRLKSIGLIPEACVVGHVVARVLPLSRFTFFH